ncbi:hypothetical protein GCM10023205_74210 [Yinghuangia aomiensis]|uniref:Uncharacterized protein n=1 Tax=Yinghuangia aomiensis TaxID=676205 RepID=A0ABP9I919_9ACTN
MGFSGRSAGDLRRLAENSPGADKRGGNEWRRLIDVGVAASFRADSCAERRDYRDAALLAMDAARRHASIDDLEWLERVVRFRVNYLLKFSGDVEDAASEVDSIVALFITASTPDRPEDVARVALGQGDFEDYRRKATLRRVLSKLTQVRANMSDTAAVSMRDWLDG